MPELEPHSRTLLYTTTTTITFLQWSYHRRWDQDYWFDQKWPLFTPKYFFLGYMDMLRCPGQTQAAPSHPRRSKSDAWGCCLGQAAFPWSELYRPKISQKQKYRVPTVLVSARRLSSPYPCLLINGVFGLRNELVHHLLIPHFFVWFVEWNRLMHHHLIPHKLRISTSVSLWGMKSFHQIWGMKSFHQIFI